MITRPLLDPRHFRIDDILRRPYTADAHFGSSGPHLSAVHPDCWGFTSGVHWKGGSGFGLFTLTLRADGEPVTPANAISRPSHLTLHGVSGDGAVQITEDKFITNRDVAVSIVSLRNAGRYDADVQIDLSWHLAEGMQALDGASIYALREAPPGDDLSLHLPPESYRVLTFLTALAPDREEARRAAWSVFDAEEAAFPRRAAHYILPDANPLLSHTRRYQEWFDTHAPRFDCPDPWLAKLWYHGLHTQRWLSPSLLQQPAAVTTQPLSGLSTDQVTPLVRARFIEGDFERPCCDEDSSAWPAAITSQVLGITVRGDEIEVSPSALAASWEYFCLEDFPVGSHRLTLVWDAPAAPADAYDDGDKGVTLYLNSQSVHHGTTLTPFRINLANVVADAAP